MPGEKLLSGQIRRVFRARCVNALTVPARATHSALPSVASSSFTVRALTALALSLFALSQTRAATFLFDASHAEVAGNADWVIDEDSGTPQRIPTPTQTGITAATPETYWTGAISAWGVELVKRGHQVETLPLGTPITFGDGTNTQDLSHYNVFAVIEPNRVFSTAEKTAIVQYVQAGGRLFLCADHLNSDRDGDGWDSPRIWNDLFATNSVQTAPFGLVFNPDNISPANETADSAVDNPLTHGPAGIVTRFLYANGASLTINPAQNPSVRAAIWTSATHTNSNVMVAYGTFGAGKFVATGDSSPIDDGTGAPGNNLFDGWDDRNGDDARLIINASLWLIADQTPQQPPNDNFANAITLSGFTPSAGGTNALATKETGEPDHGGNPGGKSVWWNWTAPSSGDATINTNGSNFAALLGVYTGSSVNALTPVVPNGPSRPQAPNSSIAFAATAGVTYRIAIDGTDGASGNLQLSVILAAPPIAGPATIASWNFDTTPFPNPIPATTGSGSLNTSGWGGTVTNFSGVAGQSLALVGAAGNGTYIEIAFSMTNYSGLSVTFATRGTSGSYTSGLWSWSVNGGPFTTLPGVNTAATSTTFTSATVDFTGVAALDNAGAVRLRYTLSGATNSQGNNRIDNLLLNATAVPIVTVNTANPNGYEAGAQPASVTFTSSLTAPAGGLPVQFLLAGTAMPPGAPAADYSLGGNSGAGAILIPAGATSATLAFTPLADNDPTEFDETATATVQPAAGYLVGPASSATVTIHDDTPYNPTWANQFPGFNGANAAPLLDLDGDGISNFAEFAFNGNPTQSDPAILPVAGEIALPDPNDGNTIKPYPTITFRRRTDAPNLIYSPKSSTDFFVWSNALQFHSSSPGPGPNIATVVYRALSPLTGNGAVAPIFLRVDVSLNSN